MAAFEGSGKSHNCAGFGLPSLVRTFEQAWLWGYNPNLCFFGTEPDAFASTRILYSGSLQVICFPPSAWQETGDFANLPALVEHLKALTPSQLETHAANEATKLFHTSLHAGDTMVTPAGWVSCFSPLNNTHVSGLRKSWLPKFEDEQSARAQITEMRALLEMATGGSTDDGVLKVAIDFLESHTLTLTAASVPPAAPAPAAKRARTT